MLKCYYANIALLEERIRYGRQLIRLDEERRRRISRLKNMDDRKRSVLASALVNYAIYEDGKDASFIKIVRTPEGKPYLKDNWNLVADSYIKEFSISHSGEYSCAILSDKAVGIDIENSQRTIFQEGREKQLEAMAKKCFASAEWKCFSMVDAEEKKHLFLEYWTRKESYSKCVGLGMKMDFSTIDTETNKDKYFTTWTEDGYCISIYVEDGNYSDLEIIKTERI